MNFALGIQTVEEALKKQETKLRNGHGPNMVLVATDGDKNIFEKRQLNANYNVTNIRRKSTAGKLVMMNQMNYLQSGYKNKGDYYDTLYEFIQ